MYKQLKNCQPRFKNLIVLPSERSSIVPAVYVGRFTKAHRLLQLFIVLRLLNGQQAPAFNTQDLSLK